MWFENVVIILTWFVILSVCLKNCIKTRNIASIIFTAFDILIGLIYFMRNILGVELTNAWQVLFILFMYVIPLLNLYVYRNDIAIKQNIICVLGKFYYSMGRYDIAAKLYTHSIRTNKKNITSNNYYILGRCLRKEKRYSESRDMLIDAIELDKTNYMAYYELGLTLEESDKKDTAIIMFSNALKANPEYKEAKIALAITYSEIGRYKEAMALYEELIKEENANEEVWYNLGNIYYYNQGDSNKAEECYLKATEINNKLYVAWFNLGIINYLKGDYGLSIKAFELAKQNDALKDKACFNLAKCYAAIKENRKAIKILSKLISTNEECTSKIKDEIVFEEILPDVIVEEN